MNQNLSYGERYPRSHEEDEALVALESDSYVEFDLWMDSALAQLVSAWKHLAAPNAEHMRKWSFKQRSK